MIRRAFVWGWKTGPRCRREAAAKRAFQCIGLCNEGVIWLPSLPHAIAQCRDSQSASAASPLRPKRQSRQPCGPVGRPDPRRAKLPHCSLEATAATILTFGVASPRAAISNRQELETSSPLLAEREFEAIKPKMGDDNAEGGDRRSRPRKHDNELEDDRTERKRRYRDDEPSRRNHRSQSRERGPRRRSRSPSLRDRRSRSRDRERRTRDRDLDRDSRRRRSGERNSGRRHQEHDDSRPSRPKPRRDGDDKEPKPDTARSLVKRAGPLPSQGETFAVSTGEEPEKPIEKPNFRTTGVLAAASNSITQADGTTITLKYHEPAEARKPPPRDAWKLFVFKGQDIVDTVELGTRSCWLIGRELAVVDLPAEHPSISKQHAVIQFRYTEKRNEFGDKIGRVKPYLIDLQSANGTMLNHDKVPDSRYLELRNKDMIQFGSSTREYVLMLPPKE